MIHTQARMISGGSKRQIRKRWERHRSSNTCKPLNRGTPSERSSERCFKSSHRRRYSRSKHPKPLPPWWWWARSSITCRTYLAAAHSGRDSMTPPNHHKLNKLAGLTLIPVYRKLCNRLSDLRSLRWMLIAVSELSSQWIMIRISWTCRSNIFSIPGIKPAKNSKNVARL